MKMQVFSIFDKKAIVFSQPFFLQNQGVALRAFADLAQDNSSKIAKHPEDYDLYQLANFDDVEGSFESLKQPVFITHALDFIKPTQN